ncbi:MAG: T9SS type A sorting domain-containing protein [Bacteroidota bacterium]
MKKRFIFLLVSINLVLSIETEAQTATFNITYNGFTTQAQTAFQFAADQWGNTVVSSIPIKINVYFTPLIPGLLGITFPNGELNFAAAPLADTWYSTALANALSAAELNPGEMDIDVYLNSAANWYYGLSGTVPPAQYDLVTVALHEITHGLGFVGLAKKTGSDGSFGLLLASDFAPLTTSFPWPDLDTLPSAFDRLSVNNLDQPLDTFTNPGAALGAQFTGQNIFSDGPFAVAANSGIKPKIYAPSTFALGSSMVHLDEATYPAGNINELMTPSSTPGNANHNPGPITLGILKDIGWTLNPALEINENHADYPITLYPNPVKNILSIAHLPASVTNAVITIDDVSGRELSVSRVFNSDKTLDVSDFKPGFYLFTLTSGNEVLRASFIKN